MSPAVAAVMILLPAPLQKGEYKVPEEFEPGAWKLARKRDEGTFQGTPVDAKLEKEFGDLASAGKVDAS